MLSIILLVFAFVLAVLAAVWVTLPDPGRGRLIAASLAFFYAALLFGKEAIGKYMPILLIGFILTGCETGADGKKHLSDKAKAALDHLGEDVLDIGENALTGALTGVTANLVSQGVSGEKFDSSQLSTAAALGAFNGAAKGLRSLEGHRAAPTTEEIATTIAQSTGSPEVSKILAPGVAGAITAAVAKGAPVSAAIETAAIHLDEQGVR